MSRAFRWFSLPKICQGNRLPLATDACALTSADFPLLTPAPRNKQREEAETIRGCQRPRDREDAVLMHFSCFVSAHLNSLLLHLLFQNPSGRLHHRRVAHCSEIDAAGLDLQGPTARNPSEASPGRHPTGPNVKNWDHFGPLKIPTVWSSYGISKIKNGWWIDYFHGGILKLGAVWRIENLSSSRLLNKPTCWFLQNRQHILGVWFFNFKVKLIAI